MNRATTVVLQSSSHGPTNALLLILFAVYLGMVLYQGNLGDLWDALKADIAGGTSKPHFWQWAIAVFLLYYISETPSLSDYTEPFFWLVIVAFLINLSMKNPQFLQNLVDAAKTVLGRN